jgi:hypothetical protein
MNHFTHCSFYSRTAVHHITAIHTTADDIITTDDKMQVFHNRCQSFPMESFQGNQSLDFADEPITSMTLPTAFLSLKAAKAR